MPRATVLTFGNSASPFHELLHNTLHNIHRMADPPRLVVHCMDDALHAECIDLLAHNFSRMPASCYRADCCTPAQGRYWRSVMPKNALNEAIGIYKMRATIRHLKEQASPVVLMDADAMVLDRACFDELFAYEEDMVAQMEGHLACPAAVEESIGFTINTGMILFRPSMLAVLELLVELRDNQTCTQAADWMRHEHSRITCPRNESQGTRIGYRYRAHCSDQEILNRLFAFRGHIGRPTAQCSSSRRLATCPRRTWRGRSKLCRCACSTHGAGGLRSIRERTSASNCIGWPRQAPRRTRGSFPSHVARKGQASAWRTLRV